MDSEVVGREQRESNEGNWLSGRRRRGDDLFCDIRARKIIADGRPALDRRDAESGPTMITSLVEQTENVHQPSTNDESSVG